MRYFHRHDENGFLIVTDNSERCRDCGEDDQNIWYVDDGSDGSGGGSYALCRKCDPEREEDHGSTTGAR